MELSGEPEVKVEAQASDKKTGNAPFLEYEVSRKCSAERSRYPLVRYSHARGVGRGERAGQEADGGLAGWCFGGYCENGHRSISEAPGFYEQMGVLQDCAYVHVVVPMYVVAYVYVIFSSLFVSAFQVCSLSVSGSRFSRAIV